MRNLQSQTGKAYHAGHDQLGALALGVSPHLRIALVIVDAKQIE